MPDPTVPLQKPTPPCRIHVILAREASMGVIFRREPSRRVQILHWDTATDTFTPGQWFHGRIYEKRCDLSPNGHLMIYRTMKSNARTRSDQEYTDAWTAISKPPYLTALAHWPCRASVGGGLFLSDNKIWLNHWGLPEQNPIRLPKGLCVYACHTELLEEAMLSRRLERDGWTHVQERLDESLRHDPSIYEKPHPPQSLILVRKTTMTRFHFQYTYGVRNKDGPEEMFKSAEWADWDHQGRLVFAQNGKIFALAADAIGQEPPQELIDLNDNKPETLEAPDWAKVW